MEKNDQKPRTKYGRRFDEEFKRDAVRMLESRVRTAQQLAEELGVSVWSLKRSRAALRAGLGTSSRCGDVGGGKCPIAARAGICQSPAGHSKKSLGHLGPGTAAFYEVITKMRPDQSCYSVTEMCLALGVSRSGLYDHGHKNQSDRRQEDALLAEQISLIFLESRQTYGCRRIQQMLRRHGIQCGKNRICRLMEQQGLRPVQKCRFRPQTTQSRHAEPIAPNRLQELPEAPQRPNQVWTADLTYIPTLEEGWSYFAAEMDLCSKRIAGWKLDDSLAAPLAVEAFQRAVRRWPAPELHHSDRGVQYASQLFRNVLNIHKVSPSMSRKANCYDNAAMESFFATLKTECFQEKIPKNRAEARAMLFDYIEIFYNPKRIHSALGYLSPLEFENFLNDELNLQN